MIERKALIEDTVKGYTGGPRYKIGDRVKVRNIMLGCASGDIRFVTCMKEFCGKVVEIECVNKDKTYSIKGSYCEWAEEWFEDLAPNEKSKRVYIPKSANKFKYRVGDKVRIKFSQYCKNTSKMDFNDDMKEFCGEYAIVKELHDVYDRVFYVLDTNNYMWVEDWLEPASTTLTPKYKIGDRVRTKPSQDCKSTENYCFRKEMSEHCDEYSLTAFRHNFWISQKAYIRYSGLSDEYDEATTNHVIPIFALEIFRGVLWDTISYQGTNIVYSGKVDNASSLTAGTENPTSLVTVSDSKWGGADGRELLCDRADTHNIQAEVTCTVNWGVILNINYGGMKPGSIKIEKKLSVS